MGINKHLCLRSIFLEEDKLHTLDRKDLVDIGIVELFRSRQSLGQDRDIDLRRLAIVLDKRKRHIGVQKVQVDSRKFC